MSEIYGLLIQSAVCQLDFNFKTSMSTFSKSKESIQHISMHSAITYHTITFILPQNRVFVYICPLNREKENWRQVAPRWCRMCLPGCIGSSGHSISRTAAGKQRKLLWSPMPRDWADGTCIWPQIPYLRSICTGAVSIAHQIDQSTKHSITSCPLQFRKAVWSVNEEEQNVQSRLGFTCRCVWRSHPD